MSDPVKIVVLVAVLLVAYAAMRAGWQRRVHRANAAVPELPAVPVLGSPRLGPLEATYLATAGADDRLARIAAHGLAVRAHAAVTVHDAGVLVRRTGSADLFVPAAAIEAVTRASGMAGTAVGADRVVVLRWRHGDVVLDTGLLPRHAAEVAGLVDAVQALAGGPAAAAPDADAPADAQTDGSPA